jgi:hypothetical protein
MVLLQPLSCRRGVPQGLFAFHHRFEIPPHQADSRAVLHAPERHHAVFSNPGMSLEQPEIDDAKRVDPL